MNEYLVHSLIQTSSDRIDHCQSKEILKADISLSLTRSFSLSQYTHMRLEVIGQCISSFVFRNNMNKKQYQFDEQLVRSETRIRQSVRCLPRGHFQQIRQMFDQSIPSPSPIQITRQFDENFAQHSKTMPRHFNEILFENDHQPIESSKSM